MKSKLVVLLYTCSHSLCCQNARLFYSGAIAVGLVCEQWTLVLLIKMVLLDDCLNWMILLHITVALTLELFDFSVTLIATVTQCHLFRLVAIYVILLPITQPSRVVYTHRSSFWPFVKTIVNGFDNYVRFVVTRDRQIDRRAIYNSGSDWSACCLCFRHCRIGSGRC